MTPFLHIDFRVGTGMYQTLLLLFSRHQIRVDFLSDLNYNLSDSRGKSNPFGSQSWPPKGISWWKIVKNDKEVNTTFCDHSSLPIP